mmetsp:Transcript_37203/g.93295  ORF Transcript_37203/g.93295 Transcript_37203/m.93295 type:complete len:608 (-) Transcript_37203:144-1967(-)
MLLPSMKDLKEQVPGCGATASLFGSPCASPEASPPPAVAGMFCVNLDFSHVALDRPPCSCCQPVTGAGAPPRQAPCPVLAIHGDPNQLANADDHQVAPLLQRLFGAEGLFAIFGRADVGGARLIRGGGMNHVFMVAHAGRLVKCVRPQSEHFSESQEAERLRVEAPGLAADNHAVFPLATFRCRPSSPLWSQHTCEIVVFEYLENCRSLRDLIRMFERTHPTGALQSTAACPAHRNSGSCEHSLPLQALVVQQVVRLGLRFQVLYGRRHGDLKADNVLIDRRGVPRLADFLSPFCKTCDREEFLNSITSANPAIQAVRGAFDGAWQGEAQRVGEAAVRWRHGASPVEPGEAARNAQLMEALETLLAASQSNSLFGPMPSLLNGFGIPAPTPPTLPPAPNLPYPNLAECSPTPSLTMPSLRSPPDCSPLKGMTPSFFPQGPPGQCPSQASPPACPASATPPLGCNLFPFPKPSGDQMGRFGGASSGGAGGGPPPLPFTGQASPQRGLRSPASPVLPAAEREALITGRGNAPASFTWPAPPALQSQTQAEAAAVGHRNGASLWRALAMNLRTQTPAPGANSPGRPFCNVMEGSFRPPCPAPWSHRSAWR